MCNRFPVRRGAPREKLVAARPVHRLRVEEDGPVFFFERQQDYTYRSNRNSIVFNTYIPDALAEIFVEYDVRSGQARDAF